MSTTFIESTFGLDCNTVCHSAVTGICNEEIQNTITTHNFMSSAMESAGETCQNFEINSKYNDAKIQLSPYVEWGGKCHIHAGSQQSTCSASNQQNKRLCFCTPGNEFKNVRMALE